MSLLTPLIKAHINVIEIVSYEYLRVQGYVNEASNDLNRTWHVWNICSGLKKYKDKSFYNMDGYEDDAEEILNWYESDDAKNSILILEDYHPYLENSNKLIRQIRNIAQKQYEDRTLILSQPIKCLPVELDKEVYVMELDLPSRDDLEVILNVVCSKYNVAQPTQNEKIVDAALGLTIMEAERAFSKAIVQNNKMTNDEIPIIISEKENIIKNSGHLEYYSPKETMEDIGGLDNLKEWLKRRGKAFEHGAKDYGLETPRGILLLGIPGTGKSLSAKAVGATWKFPIIKLDMGKVFGGIVGESESNMRQALKISEAVSPSILWIDEIEKAFSGSASSGRTDGGTTSRVLGTFLTWMQEKKSSVFVVATANDISNLPPELLRKGRVDEIFFVDLPLEEERKEILKIHIKKYKREPNNFDLDLLAKESEGFSGAEIEEAIKEALFKSYDDNTEVNTAYILEAIKKTYPISKTMKEVISNLRKWSSARAVFASSKRWETESSSKVPELKQEKINNPFV